MNYGLKPADILLPKKDFEKFAVIACDQYTSEPQYWQNAAAAREGAPSALDLILPEPKQVGQVSSTFTSMAGRTRWRVICISPNLLRGRMLCLARSFCMFLHMRS